MTKVLVYTSNLPFIPKKMEEVVTFAKEADKFRITNVEMNGYLKNVKTGDNIITKKGNSIYVIKAFDSDLEHLNEEDAKWLDDITRNYDIRKVGITSVANIVKFETWCSYARPLINTTNKNSNSKNSNSMKNWSSKMKEMFMPTEVNDIKISVDGSLCVQTKNGYVTINTENQLIAYPEEMVISLPVFTICKPKEQIAVGDVIALDNSYAKIVKIEDTKIKAISYTGSGKTIHTIKDILFNQTMVRVVVSLAGNIGGQINPMMLFAMSKDNDNSLLPFMMMQQNNGVMNMNPMMLMMLGDNDMSKKDLLMMSMLSGNNMFGNMFNNQTKKDYVEPNCQCKTFNKKEEDEGIENEPVVENELVVE